MTTILNILYNNWSILVHSFFLLESIITVLVTNLDFIMRRNFHWLQIVFVQAFCNFLNDVTATAAFPHYYKYRNFNSRRKNR